MSACTAPTTLSGQPDRIALAAWLWERLRPETKPVALGRLIAEAREVGHWPTAGPGETGPKLGLFFKARKWVASAHPGWHVAQTETTTAAGKAVKLWALASGPDPDIEPDYDALRSSIGLRRFVENDLGQPEKGGRWPCPIHGGESPNFSVDGDHWRCWSCNASGDVFDYLAAREGISTVEAARRLDPTGSFRQRTARRADTPKPSTEAAKPTRPPVAPAATSEPRQSDRPAWDDPDWQSIIDAAARKAEGILWSREGKPAVDWLRRRGVDDSTIRRFRLGFLPNPVASDEPLDCLGTDDKGKPRYVRFARGILIPWLHPSSWLNPVDDRYGDPGPRWIGANVRRLAEADVNAPLPDDRAHKYQAVTGSERGHCYPFASASMPGEPVIVCEGEFDSLIAWQEFGPVANVVSFGGAGQNLSHLDARVFLAACPDWLLLFDQDQAGDSAARAMTRRAPHRCRRLYLPSGVNDLNDLHRSGRSALDWLRSEYERFGWLWPSWVGPSRGRLSTGTRIILNKECAA